MALVVAACAGTGVLYLIVFGPVELSEVPTIALLYVFVFGVIVTFSVWIAGVLGLPTLLLLSSLDRGQRWRRFATYGVAPGLAISLINAALYRAAGAAAPMPWWLDRLDGHFDLIVLSAYSATQEETFYRLFAVPFVVAIGMRFRGWRPRFALLAARRPARVEPPKVPSWLILLAVGSSAVLFGLRHSFIPLRAVAFGLLLGWIYLRGGWESAVTAHFLGNYLLFASIYL